jgi:hypothetical protein
VTEQFLGKRQTEECDSPAILLTLAGMMVCELMLLWEVDSAEAELRVKHSWSAPDLPASELVKQLAEIRLWPAEALPGRVWASYRTEQLDEIAEDGHAERCACLAKSGIRSSVAFPVFQKGRVLYIVECLSRHSRFWKNLSEDWIILPLHIAMAIKDFETRQAVRDGLGDETGCSNN